MKRIKNLAVLILLLVVSAISVFVLVGCNDGSSSSGSSTEPTENNNPIDNLVFVEQSDGTYGVKTSNKNIEGALEIPSVYNNAEVSILLERGFDYCTKLTSVIIPNTVKIIDKNAFSFCYHLNSVTIYPSIEEIRYEAFRDCHFDLMHIGSRADFNYTSANGYAWSVPTKDYVNFIYSEEQVWFKFN